MNYPLLTVYAYLNPEDIEWIESNASCLHLMAGEVIVEEGSTLKAIYVVMEGLLVVTIQLPDGQKKELSHLGPGSLFGEISWLDGQPASATVRATENSIVLALSRAVLEAQLQADTGFAARFFKGLATLGCQRLRRNEELTRALSVKLKEFGNLPEASGPLWAALAQFKDSLARADKELLGAHGIPGTLKEETAQAVRRHFDDICLQLHGIMTSGKARGHDRGMLGALVQKEFLPYLLLTRTAERFYSKPRGYAGDFLTIEMIYENRPEGQGRLGPLVDACFLDKPPTRAVRNRRGLMAKELFATMDRCHPAQITSLACGPAREIFDVFDTGKVPSDAVFTAIDIDQQALALVSERSQQRRLGNQVRTCHGNLIYLAMGRQRLDLPPQDLVYSIWLIDYFNDKFVLKLINWIHDRLSVNGRAILGNFHPRNTDRAFMDHVLEWQLIHRDENDMNRLFEQSKFRRPCSRILFEEEGINMFAESVKG